mgnify:CR=1 FL=1
MPEINPVILDWIGYIASLIVLVSLLMTSIKKLRWINLVGALLFGTYGFLIASIPTGFMNLGIAVIDIFFLVKMYTAKDYYKVLPIEKKTTYLTTFIDFYKKDLHMISDLKNIDLDQADVKFYILRNMTPAGVFIGLRYSSDTLDIKLDYAVPQYRDFKIGKFVFEENAGLFLDLGYHKLRTITNEPSHIKYLLRMGFKETTLEGQLCYIKAL